MTGRKTLGLSARTHSLRRAEAALIYRKNWHEPRMKKAAAMVHSERQEWANDGHSVCSTRTSAEAAARLENAFETVVECVKVRRYPVAWHDGLIQGVNARK